MDGAARGAGLTPQQHQTLLAIKGFPGRDYVSIGEIAARLHLRHHSAVGLVDRLVRRKLVRRTPSATDRRRQEVRLTAGGERVLDRLSQAHVTELRQLAAEANVALSQVRKQLRDAETKEALAMRLREEKTIEFLKSRAKYS